MIGSNNIVGSTSSWSDRSLCDGWQSSPWSSWAWGHAWGTCIHHPQDLMRGSAVLITYTRFSVVLYIFLNRIKSYIGNKYSYDNRNMFVHNIYELFEYVSSDHKYTKLHHRCLNCMDEKVLAVNRYHASALPELQGMPMRRRCRCSTYCPTTHGTRRWSWPWRPLPWATASSGSPPSSILSTLWPSRCHCSSSCRTS